MKLQGLISGTRKPWRTTGYRTTQRTCLIDDVREVVPHCVMKDIRDRWPNHPNVSDHTSVFSFSPTHQRSLTVHFDPYILFSIQCQWLRFFESVFSLDTKMARHLKLWHSNLTLIVVKSTDCVTMLCKKLSICHPWTHRLYLTAPCVGQFCLVADWSDSIVQMWLHATHSHCKEFNRTVK